MTHTDNFNAILRNSKKEKVKSFIKPIQTRTNMNELQTSLSKCTIDGNILRLPTGFLPNYGEVRTALLKAGASYKRNTFIFPNDAEPYINRLMDGDSINIKKEFQFFATPAPLAEYLVALSDTHPNHLILEPSAGQGAIIKAILQQGEGYLVHCYELMDINRNVLSKINDAVILGDDFLAADPVTKFDRIIANPPFSKNQDIDHIYKMWNCLKNGGRMVTIASKHWQLSNNKKETEFREWLQYNNAVIMENFKGDFKESGTMVSSVIIILEKN